ncbi:MULTISPECIES: hypothetical protein [unclassified Methanoregula]|uniref:hypothetical protein n=1 Tax=unclassified Methanoregula TaxID=2649730 RepID=UPI0009D36ABC|nr:MULTISPECIES: hypothetical protein [unclassified Methanoregula]OPX65283.1 MAG: hypothetical protein A4E33_00316 [Methanoregula sp. PtaB.Bin085]OPY32192.1 MAG: hypothetical protein A4E34_02566 [Methanoregula sp. PtaU1.Bin006]
MSGSADIIRPNGAKLLLAATFLIPSLFLVLLITGFTLWEPLVPVALSAVIAYGAACAADSCIRSRVMKIAVASAAALASIFLGSLLIRSMTLVCDPVHDPGLVCDPVHVPETPEPSVIPTVMPAETTPMIFDPVHDPGSCSADVCTAAPGIATGLVAEKLEECRRKCGR